MLPEANPTMGRVLARAWSDAQFKARLLAKPKAALRELEIMLADDPSISIEQVLRMQAAQERAGAHHHFVRYRDRGHMFITEQVIAQSCKLIARQMAGS
jgi:hypothetical protein